MHFHLQDPTPDISIDPLAGHLKGRTDREVDRVHNAYARAERARPKQETPSEPPQQIIRRMGEALARLYVQRGIDVQIVDKDLIREGFTRDQIYGHGDEAIAVAHRIIAEAAAGHAA